MTPDHHPDLQKLRRFSLAIGLVLATYSLALEFDVSRTVQPLGLPFNVVDPKLLPIGLMLASVYSAARFWYYGTMKSPTPTRRRREDLLSVGFDANYEVTQPMNQPAEQREDFATQFQRYFPRVAGSVIDLEWEIDGHHVHHETVQGEDTGEVVVRHASVYRVTRMIVPTRVRAAMALEQVDYTAPIWVNLIALTLASIELAGLPVSGAE